MSRPTCAAAERASSYRWVVLGVALLTISIAYSVRMSFGVLLLPLQAAFGSSQSATVAAYTVHWLAFGFAAPFFGGLADRVSPRLMMPLAALGLALVLVVTAQARELWQFYVMYGIVAGVAVCALGMPPHVAIVARWFATGRGTAYSILNSGVGFSLFLAAPAQWLTLHYGWPAALLASSALLVAVVVPVTALLHRPLPPVALAPGDATARPPTGPSVAPSLHQPSQSSARRGLGSVPYWCLFAIYLLYPAQQHVLVVYQLPYLVNRGYDPLVAASALSGAGLATVAGLLGSGWPSDRLGREPVFSAGVALLLVGIGALALAGQGVSILLPVYALAYGVGLGLISPQMSASAADIFSGPRFGTIYGTFNLAAGLGAALAPLLVGHLIDVTGQYDLALAVAAALTIASGGLIWLAAPRRRWVPPTAARS